MFESADLYALYNLIGKFIELSLGAPKQNLLPDSVEQLVLKRLLFC
jgi:hypothetical protein